jgi:hypothetical protein
MPRDKRGIGRTGGKARKAAAKRELAAAAAEAAASPTSTSPAMPVAALTFEEEEEDLVIPAPSGTAAEEPAPPKKWVRFARLPPKSPVQRRTKPVSTGWSWGGHFDRPRGYWSTMEGVEPMPPPDVVARGVQRRLDKLKRKEFLAHYRGLRVHEHVLGGCVGGWNDRWGPVDTCPWNKPFRSHRDWCPGPVQAHCEWPEGASASDMGVHCVLLPIRGVGPDHPWYGRSV